MGVPVAEVVAAWPGVQVDVQGVSELLVGSGEGMVLRADVQPQLRVAVQPWVRRGGGDYVNGVPGPGVEGGGVAADGDARLLADAGSSRRATAGLRAGGRCIALCYPLLLRISARNVTIC